MFGFAIQFCEEEAIVVKNGKTLATEVANMPLRLVHNGEDNFVGSDAISKLRHSCASRANAIRKLQVTT
jgi:hypothetical protein